MERIASNGTEADAPTASNPPFAVNATSTRERSGDAEAWRISRSFESPSGKSAVGPSPTRVDAMGKMPKALMTTTPLASPLHRTVRRVGGSKWSNRALAPAPRLG